MAVSPVVHLEDVANASPRSSPSYQEVVRHASLSAGVYVIPANGHDLQSPHGEDEVYVVLRGRARFRSGGSAVAVAPGDLLFVGAHEPHRFEEVTEKLVLAVIFTPPEGSSPK